MKKLDLENTKTVENSHGVYWIYWNLNNVPRSINRFIGSDPEGLLYIGRSTNLRRRLDQFRNAAFGGSQESHVAGKKIFERPVLKREISKDDLTFKVEYTWEDNYKDREVSLIKEYAEKYGEVPPLNG